MSQKDIIFPVLESIKIRCRLHTILQCNMPLHAGLTKTCATHSYTAIQTVLSFGHIDDWAVEVDARMSLASLMSRFVFLCFGVYLCTFTSTLDQPSMDPWCSCNETRQGLYWSYNFLLFKFFHGHEDCYDMYCIVILYIFKVPLPHLYTFFNH